MAIIAEVWSDLSADLIQDGQARLKKVINVEAVKTSIDNILRTYQGERVFLPQFASRLRALLFEPISEDTVKAISDNIKQSIEIWDNRVSVTGVDMRTDADSNFTSATINFQILSYTEVFSHTVPLTK